jgi:carbonic anhydrase
MDPFVSKLKDVFKYKSSTEIGGIDLNRIIPEKLSNYFRYSGSLTTPGCDEVVEWFVMDGPVFTLSEEQLLDFQTLENSHGYPILMNSRPVQSLNDRLVRRSFYDAKVARSKQFLQSASGYNYAAINRISFNQLYMGLVVIFFALKFI